MAYKNITMKKLIAALLCAQALLPALLADECTPIRTVTSVGTFAGELCIHSDTQTLELEGTLSAKGHLYRVSATGTIVLEKANPIPFYTIAGTQTMIDNAASAIGSLQVNVSENSLSNALARFTSKVINTDFHFQK